MVEVGRDLGAGEVLKNRWIEPSHRDDRLPTETTNGYPGPWCFQATATLCGRVVECVASSERIADTAGPVGSNRVDAGRGEEGELMPGSCGGGVLADVLLAVLRNVPTSLDSPLGTFSSTPPVSDGGLTPAYF
jgi:hypothetical protein